MTNEPMTNDIAILKVEGLTVYQGSYLAVRDVSFELLPGTDTAIVGPNGAGKSTLVKAVLDLIPRSAGTIEILGRPIARLGRLRHLLGYMPQNFIFDRSFPISVSELVGSGMGKGRKKGRFIFLQVVETRPRKIGSSSRSFTANRCLSFTASSYWDS